MVYKSELQKWTNEKKVADSSIKNVIQSLPDFHDRNPNELATVYQDVMTQRESLRPLKDKSATVSKELNELKQTRLNLIEAYKSALDEKNNSVNKQIKSLNKHQLNGKLRLEIQPQGNIQKLLDYLEKITWYWGCKAKGNC